MTPAARGRVGASVTAASSDENPAGPQQGLSSPLPFGEAWAPSSPCYCGWLLDYPTRRGQALPLLAKVPGGGAPVRIVELEAALEQ